MDLTAHIHPRNQGMQILGHKGRALNVVADPRVPDDEVWLYDRGGKLIKRVSLFDGQAGTSVQGVERGTTDGRDR